MAEMGTSGIFEALNNPRMRERLAEHRRQQQAAESADRGLESNFKERNALWRRLSGTEGMEAPGESDLLGMLRTGPGMPDTNSEHQRIQQMLARQRDRYGVGLTERGMEQEDRAMDLDSALLRTQATSDTGLAHVDEQRQLMSHLLGVGNQMYGQSIRSSMFAEQLAQRAHEQRMRKKLAKRARRYGWINFFMGGE